MAPRSSLRHVVLEGSPEISRRPRHVLETWRHHADHEVAIVVERDRPTQDPRIGIETAPPQAVAQDHDPRPASLIVRPLKSPTHRRHDAEDLEILGRDQLALEPLRLVRALKGGSPAPHHGDRLEGAGPRRQLAIGPEGQIDPRPIVAPIRDGDHLAGIGIGQRPQEDWVHHPEDRATPPIPSASVSTAMAVKPGSARSPRTA